jgi:hypothetical protein
MVEDLSGVDLWPPMSKPESWAAWQLPDTEVAALFRAAANFFRAAPWTTMADSSALEFAPREGSPWAGVVMGFGGEVFGLALYTEPEDLTDLLDDDALEYEGLGALGALKGRVITLFFEEAHELPRAMRREVARKGWEVVSPLAYPTLVALNTPGGGVRRADLGMLTEALTLVPEFLAETERADASGTFMAEWTSPETGTVVSPFSAPDRVGHR